MPALGVAYPVLAVASCSRRQAVLSRRDVPGAGRRERWPAADWLARRPRRGGLIVAAVVLSLASMPITLPVLPASSLHGSPIVAMDYDAGEAVG